jgi:threonine aldolase
MRDFRSDTVTQPTPAMRQAMAEAPVGDDVCDEDPTVHALQDQAAQLLGKEAALFVPSGTFANQCALLTLCGSGNEVLLAERCHIVQHEAGAAGLISRVQLRTLSPESPHLLEEDILPRLRTRPDIHYPKSGLLCVEQATSDGTVTPLESLQAIRRIGMAREIPIYMDGARLFNAAVALNVEPKDIAAQADAIGICLSKGLGAPAGSLLVGSKAFIRRARNNRKIMGGGMRQVGILAAAGIVAFKDILPQLKEDHRRADDLSTQLQKVPGVELVRAPEINMVFVRIQDAPGDLPERLAKDGFKTYPDEGGVYRYVTHHHHSDEDIAALAAALKKALA